MKRTARPNNNPLPMLALIATIVLLTIAVIVAGTRALYGVDLPTFFQSVRTYNEAQATAEVIGTPRPAAPPVAAPAAPGRAQGAAPVSQPAEDSSAPLAKATPAGHEDTAPAVLAAPEPPKATPAGKAEPEKPAKVREGKGTP